MYFASLICGIAVAHEINPEHQHLLKPVFEYGELTFFSVKDAHFVLCDTLPPPAGLRNDPGFCQILVRLDREQFYWGIDRVPSADLIQHATEISYDHYLLSSYLRRKSPPTTGFRNIRDAVNAVGTTGKKKPGEPKKASAIVRHYASFRKTLQEEQRFLNLSQRFRNGEALNGEDLEFLLVQVKLWDGLQARTKSWVRKFLTTASIDEPHRSTGAPLTGLRLETFQGAMNKLAEAVGPRTVTADAAGSPARESRKHSTKTR